MYISIYSVRAYVYARVCACMRAFDFQVQDPGARVLDLGSKVPDPRGTWGYGVMEGWGIILAAPGVSWLSMGQLAS